jgi:(p)ppGpp synthase/HD superfamily hydrolase
VTKIAFWLNALTVSSSVSAQAHQGQYRKDTKTPFVVHPARVAGLALRFNAPPQTVISAWFHDILEDCPGNPLLDIILPALEKMSIPPGTKISEEIIDNILFMTKNMGLPKETREKEFLDRLLSANAEMGLLKVCDRIDNLLDMPNCNDLDPNWSKNYIQNSIEVLSNLPPSTIEKYPAAVAVLADIVLNTSLGADFLGQLEEK